VTVTSNEPWPQGGVGPEMDIMPDTMQQSSSRRDHQLIML
jgi:hypothetical protein